MSIVVSLFGYQNPATTELLQAWIDGPQRVVAVVPRSSLRPDVGAFFGMADAGDGAMLTRGNLEVRLVPFLPQPRYDELLWLCDWNFVRGEDSFVRAQWALRPFVWHAYPQQERAHRVKLDAFLDVYCAGLDPLLAQALGSLWHGWNEAGPAAGIATAWRAVEAERAKLRRHAQHWAARLAVPGELAANLAQFCAERLK